jgi:hypothetical protein
LRTAAAGTPAAITAAMLKENVMTSTALTTTSAPVLVTSHGGIIRGKLKVDLGRVELTPKAIVFYRRNKLWYMFGLIGMLIAARTSGKRALDIDLGAITELARGKYGFNKKVLDLTLADGTAYRITVDKFDDFTAQLRDQLARRGKVESTGTERWTVRG